MRALTALISLLWRHCDVIRQRHCQQQQQQRVDHSHTKMLVRKNELRATLLLTLVVACLLPAAAAASAGEDASSQHHDDECPSSGVATECQACGESSTGDRAMSYVARCCGDVLVYSACRDQLDAVQPKSVAKRSAHDVDEYDKRKTPFLGKRARNPFLGKRRVNPFLGKRRNPFLGKRTPYDLDDEVFDDKRRMPFLG